MWSAAFDFLALAAALVSFLLLQRVLTTAQYGSFAGLYGLVTSFSAITYSGPGLAMLERGFRRREDLDAIQSSFLSLSLTAGAVSSVVSIALAAALIDLSLLEIVVITASELFANSVIMVCSWLVQLAVSYPAMIRVRMGTVALKLVAVPLLYTTGHLTIRNLGLAYLVLYGGFALWLVLRLLPRVGYDIGLGKPAGDVWRSSGVFALPIAANQIQLDGDKVALNAFNLQNDAGLYAAAYRVVLLATLPIRVIGQAAFHRFLAPGDAAGDGHHIRRAVDLTVVMFVVGLVVAGSLYVVSYLITPVLDLLITDEFAEAKEIVPWLALFVPLLALSGTPLNALLSLGRANERAAVHLSSALLSVILYVTLIPGRGWPGAVAATLVGETFLVVVSWAVMIHYQRRADRERARSDEAATTSRP